MAVTRYFLGGNTASGFVSFYGQFCRGPEDFLWVIKGGPGCGKSSFMKTIGKAAENAGLDVEYVLCSGDPDSVDGVYLPALHTGYADGTAPHVLEAVTPGAAGLYLDLGQFYDRIALQKERRAIELLQTRYRALYREAYARLVIHARPSCPLPAQEERKKRFLRAVTCRGLYSAEPPAGAVQLGVRGGAGGASRAGNCDSISEPSVPGRDGGRVSAGREALLPGAGYPVARSVGRDRASRAGEGPARRAGGHL